MATQNKSPSTLDGEMPRRPPQKVFLYIQLNEIKNLPASPYPFELHLYHIHNTLQKMEEPYTTETIIYQHEFNLQKPTFTMTITQDSINDLNVFSDNPLIISLYQRIPRQRKYTRNNGKATLTTGLDNTTLRNSTTIQGDTTSRDNTTETDVTKEVIIDEDAEYEEEHLELISRGHCDLLQLFHHKRFISNIDVFLYPNKHLNDYGELTFITTITSWHMYSILPMLKKENFTNLAFITMESIYNPRDNLIEISENLTLNLLFRSTIPNEMGVYKTIPLCSFYAFTQHIICEQNTSIVWENIKRDFNATKDFTYLQIETNSKVKLPKLFRNLLLTDGVDFKLNEIDPIVESALINNSLHRFVLNETMCRIMEDAIVHNRYEILLQLCKEGKPEDVLYEGLINLSVFAYPKVNYIRFAVDLKPAGTQRLGIPDRRKLPYRSRKSSYKLPTFSEKPMFVIVKICLFQRLTEKTEPIDWYNAKPDMRNKLTRCHWQETSEDEDDNDIAKELYRRFDEQITEVITYCIKKNIKSMDERRDYFCCQWENLNNILMKICGCDFNKRMPTKNNMEFREMLTHMYKTLMNRIYNLITTYSRLNVCKQNVDHEEDKQKLIELMDYYKFLIKVGKTAQSQQVFYQFQDCGNNRQLLNFYVFLYNIESMEFKLAAQYLRHQSKHWDDEYFACLCAIYINYMSALENEETSSIAFGVLLDELREFTRINSLDQDVYILLYCYYKQCNYLPGMEYTRWYFENLYEVPRKMLVSVPHSQYQMYLNIDPEINRPRSTKFYDVCVLFARLGLYGFADTVFEEIKGDCSPIEEYLIATTLKMLQKKIEPQFHTKVFKTEQTNRGQFLAYCLQHVNGNLEYEREQYAKAAFHFESLLNVPEDLVNYFALGIFRYADYMFSCKKYDLALSAYMHGVNGGLISAIHNYGVGTSLYNLGKLVEASKYFGICTEAKIHFPSAWGYLAIINLRLGRNKIALECWKNAKLFPELAIGDDVYAELNKINPSNVNLLVE